jgi:hypothetical protein
LLNFRTSFKTWVFKKWGKNSIFLGVIRGYSVPTLPVSVEIYNNNIFVRIFRFIGGLSFLLIITKFYLQLPYFLQFLCAVIASIHCTQVMIILIIKTVYSLHTLICKREKFEVINYPLNRDASIISQALYCIKFGCGATAAGASFLAGGMAYDALLEEAGRKRVFLPMIAQVYTGVFGVVPNLPVNNTTGATNTGATEPGQILNEQKVGDVTEMINKYHNMSSEERIEFMGEINKSFEDNKNNR